MGRSYRDLVAWQKAMHLFTATYRATSGFPRDELFGLTSQLKRAAVSIPANIAEGFKRNGKNDKIKFYNIAHSSLEECRYYLILANDLRFGDTEKLMNELESISKMLSKYCHS